MSNRKAGKRSKSLMDELELGTTSAAASVHSTSQPASHTLQAAGKSTDEQQISALSEPMLTTTTATTDVWISNPLIVNAFDTTAYGNPDPSGLAFIPGTTPGSGALLVSDSEVDEAPFFSANNLFYFSLSGTFDHSASLQSFTFEPTGLAFNTLTGSLFISDDNKNAIFEVDPANPEVKLSSFSTAGYAADAEDVAFDPETGHLLIIEGVSGSANPRTIFETTTDGVVIQSIALTTSVPIDLEAVAYDAARQVFYLAGGSTPHIFVVSRDGQTLLETITVLEGLTNTLSGIRVKPKGLLLAPSSDPNDDPATMSLYVADYGGDQVMDGRVYEIQLNSTQTQSPLFSAGDDIVDFNQIAPGGHLAGYQYNALAGNDVVVLPSDAAAAESVGYLSVLTAFRGGDGNDVITGGGLNDTIYGDSGTDTLIGGAGNDRLNGGQGADTLAGGLGDDRLDGGSNNDTADYSAAAGPVTVDLALGAATGEGSDTLLNIENATGSAFNDTIIGSIVANVLNGGDGNDVLRGGDGNDVLIGGDGNDVLRGGDGNDVLTGGAGIDLLQGESGHDTLKWDSADSFDGGSGFDTLDAILSTADTIDLRGPDFVSIERVRTGSGKDTVYVSLNKVLSDTADRQFIADLGSSSPDTLIIDIDGGWSATTSDTTLGPTAVAAGISIAGMTAYTFTNGTDTVTVFSNAEVVKLISSAPPLFTTGDDVIDFGQVVAGSYFPGSQYDALAGNDTVVLPLDEAVASAAGYSPTQSFHGGDGSDFVTGGALDDTIFGDSGADVLIGGVGNDILNGGSSADTLTGGLGDDLLDGGSGNDTANYAAAAGPVTVDLALGTASGQGNDTLLNIENITGSDLDDVIIGSAVVNVLLGGSGNDVLHGGDGNDTLTGGAGIDQLFGDAGHDMLKWDNADSFDGGTGFDTLDAILSSADSIDLRGSGFANLERIRTGGGKDVVTLSLSDVLSDTADYQFVADLGSGTDTLKIDLAGGWTATAPNSSLGPTGVAAGISVSGMTAYSFTNGADTVTIFTNAEVVDSQILSS